MIVLATGGDGCPSKLVHVGLSRIHRIWPITTVLCGDDKRFGKDVETWAVKHNAIYRAFVADWKRNGKKAGYYRNVEMARFKPNMVAAFPGGSSTKQMIEIAAEYGLPVFHFFPGSIFSNE